MHWAYEKAQELIEKYPEKDMFVCASGISPSGSVHIGNFREVVTTYFVAQSLKRLGKNVRFIFSWDDFDRLRKVPKNVDPSFEKYIGMPYSEVPDPHGCHSSYAEHFEREFEESLATFGIKTEFIYQTKEYRSGRYNQYILHALKRRKAIYDILMSFKTQEPTAEEREEFYPITVYCQACRKDNTEVVAFEEDTGTIEYRCTCGNQNSVDVANADNIKLSWKIDWPMRWMVEDVVFEPGGRDHSAETGSYNVSKVIAKEIFDFQAPEYVAYEFIGIKGSHGKMSSSAGNTITPGELLKIYLPEIILFIFSKYKPGAAFHIGLDQDVIRNYTEFERYQASYQGGLLKDEALQYSLALAQIRENTNLPKFNQIAGILPLVNFDTEILQEILERSGVSHDLNDIKEISERVEHWVKNWYPENMVYLNEKPDREYIQTLAKREREWLKSLCEVIKNAEQLTDEEILDKVYDICDDVDKKARVKNQNTLFNIVYKLVLNSDRGPRLPLLIKAVGVDTMLYLLDL